MSQSFKMNEIFSGKLCVHVHAYLNNYEEACSNYFFSEEQKFSSLHNLFDGEAKQYYRDTTVGTCSMYDDFKQLLISKYSNATKKEKIGQYFQKLSLRIVMDKKICDVIEALEDFRNTIAKFAPQGLLSYHTEEAKVEYLYNAVVGSKWCNIPLT